MKTKIFKRLITAVLATAMIVTTTIHASAAVSDVKPGNWAYDAVQYNVNNKLIAVDTNKYNANAPAPRQDVAYALYKLTNSNEPSAAVTSTVAKDMQNSSNAYKYSVGWCMDKGIIAGTGGGNFSPTNIVTREQMATLLYRTAKYQGLSMGFNPFILELFTDARDISSWAQDAMAWCVSNGLMNGTGNNKLSPKTTLTYAQLAQFMFNYSKFTGEQGGATTVTPEPTPVITPSDKPSYYNLTPMAVSSDNDCSWLSQTNYLYETNTYGVMTKILVDLAGPWDNAPNLKNSNWLPAGGYMKNGHRYNKYDICIDSVDGLPTQEEKLAFILINQHRINNGLPRIEWDQSTQAMAEVRALESYPVYIGKTLTAHCRPDNQYDWMLPREFYGIGILGQKTCKMYGESGMIENLGTGTEATTKVNNWIKSSGHNAVLLKSNTTHGAVAATDVGTNSGDYVAYTSNVWSFNGIEVN